MFNPLTNIILVGNIWERHQVLSQTIGTTQEEDVCYDNVNNLIVIVTTLFPLLSLLELLVYFFYNFKVDVEIDLMSHKKQNKLGLSCAKLSELGS